MFTKHFHRNKMEIFKLSVSHRICIVFLFLDLLQTFKYVLKISKYLKISQSWKFFNVDRFILPVLGFNASYTVLSIIANLVYTEPFILLSCYSVGKSCELCLIHCLKKPFRICKLQDLLPDRYTVLWNELYDTDGVKPQQFRVKHSWIWMYWQCN